MTSIQQRHVAPHIQHALSDGRLSPNEAMNLREQARAAGLDDAQLLGALQQYARSQGISDVTTQFLEGIGSAQQLDQGIDLALADGKITPDEASTLKRWAAKLGISNADRDERVQSKIVDRLIDSALEDGNITGPEARRIKATAERFGISDVDVMARVNLKGGSEAFGQYQDGNRRTAGPQRTNRPSLQQPQQRGGVGLRNR